MREEVLRQALVVNARLLEQQQEPADSAGAPASTSSGDSFACSCGSGPSCSGSQPSREQHPAGSGGGSSGHAGQQQHSKEYHQLIEHMRAMRARLQQQWESSEEQQQAAARGANFVGTARGKAVTEESEGRVIASAFPPQHTLLQLHLALGSEESYSFLLTNLVRGEGGELLVNSAWGSSLAASWGNSFL